MLAIIDYSTNIIYNSEYTECTSLGSGPLLCTQDKWSSFNFAYIICIILCIKYLQCFKFDFVALIASVFDFILYY